MKFYWVRFVSHWKMFLDFLLLNIFLKGALHQKSFLHFFQEFNYEELYAKKMVLQKAHGKDVIFFTFRGEHFLDWFIPIHLALESLYSEKYTVYYINFASTLGRIGTGLEYLQFKKSVAKKLSQHNINPFQHFSHLELESHENFPEPDMIVTTETIRHEKFQAKERVFLPHGCITKYGNMPDHIKYNHFFAPSIPEFNYPETATPETLSIQIHQVGYPKIHLNLPEKQYFDSNKPIVLYSPSLETKFLLQCLKEGILEVFKNLPEINFLIKLHPSLKALRHYIVELFEKAQHHYKNIKIDYLSGLQEIAPSTAMMVCDYGAVGAEYYLGYNRPFIAIKPPTWYQAGPDCFFNQKYAFQVTSIQGLAQAIPSGLESKKPVRSSPANEILYCFGSADQKAANTIHQILSP